MKTYFEAIKIILRLSLTILLFITLPLVVFTLITSKQTVWGIQSFVVLSGSMEPTIPTGGIIFTQKQSSYNIGDVIAFKQGSVTITHRVASLENVDGELFYQTKGDANNAADSKLIKPDQVLGKTMIKVNHVGRLIYFLKTIPGFLILIIFPSVLLIGAELWNIKKEFEKEIRKKILEQIQRNQPSYE